MKHLLPYGEKTFSIKTGLRGFCSVGALSLWALASGPANAQTKAVSVCTGVSLPPSAVTTIIDPVLTGVVEPVENTTNAILALPLVGSLIPNLNTDLTGLLATAASGDPITLQAIARDGTLVGPSDDCTAFADAYSLENPAGVSIGGNRISGLGANGNDAFAAEITSIAIGDNARTEAGATNAVALGTGASVLSAGSVAIGAGSVADRANTVSFGSVGAERILANVAAGVETTDAANYGQVLALETDLNALADTAVTYTDASGATVQLAGAGGTLVTNLADGNVAAGSTDAVNGGQLFATNQLVADNTADIATNTTDIATNSTDIANNTTNIANNTTDIADNRTDITANQQSIANLTTDVGALNNTAVFYDSAAQTTITLAGAGGTRITNVAAGAVNPGSTDAVNGAQLDATNQNVASNTNNINVNATAITTLETTVNGLIVTPGGAINAVSYDDLSQTSVTLAGAGGTTVSNVADGELSATSDDAVNGSQLFATNQAVANNTAGIAANTADIATNSTNIANNTANISANTANITQNTTNITANTTAIAQNRTDITNITTRIDTMDENAVKYDDASKAVLTLAGATGTTVTNVAAGAVSATSTDAVNGSQLNATNQAVAANGTAIAATQNAVTALDANVRNGAIGTVQYSNADNSAVPNGGVPTNNLALVGANAAQPVTLSNVGPGVLANDAVNLQQLQSGLNNNLDLAKAYTDSRIDGLGFDLNRVNNDAQAGIAGAVALASMPQPINAGQSMVSMGVGHYRGESAFAFGGSHASDDGNTVFRLNASVDTNGSVTAGGGVGIGF